MISMRFRNQFQNSIQDFFLILVSLLLTCKEWKWFAEVPPAVFKFYVEHFHGNFCEPFPVKSISKDLIGFSYARNCFLINYIFLQRDLMLAGKFVFKNQKWKDRLLFWICSNLRIRAADPTVFIVNFEPVYSVSVAFLVFYCCFVFLFCFVFPFEQWTSIRRQGNRNSIHLELPNQFIIVMLEGFCYFSRRYIFILTGVIVNISKLMDNKRTLIGRRYVLTGPTISHINYWDQVNSWKNFLKFWNGPLCKNKSGPSPLLNVIAYCQSSNTKACVRKMSQILAKIIDNRGRGIGLRIYVRYCLKK